MAGIWLNKNTFMDIKEKKDWKLSDEIASRKRVLGFSDIMKMLPNPDPILKKMGKDISVYRDLLADDHVGACVLSRKSGTTSRLWKISPGKADPKKVQFIEDKFKNLGMNNFQKENLDAALFGYQPMELMWGEEANGVVFPAAITGKPPEWFFFDNDNQLRFRSRDNFWEGELLPPRKFLCPTQDASYDNPYGISVLSKAFWPVFFKKGGIKCWVVFVEKYGMPIIIGRHPRGASETEKNELARALQNAVQDAVMVIAEDSSIELKDSPFRASSTGTFKELTTVCENGISKAILGQTLTTQTGDVGSYAATQSHMGIREDIADSDTLMTCESANTAIRWTWELNWPEDKNIPTYEMWKPKEVNTRLAERDEKLKNTGVRFKKVYFIKNHDLEEEDFEMEEPQVNPPAEFAETNKGGFPPDDIMEKIPPEELQEIAEEVMEPLINLVKKSNDYSEVMENLTEQYPLMKTEKMENLLRKAIFYSDMQGRVDVNAND